MEWVGDGEEVRNTKTGLRETAGVSGEKINDARKKYGKRFVGSAEVLY